MVLSGPLRGTVKTCWTKSDETESGQTSCLTESLEVKVKLTSVVEIIPRLCCCCRFINEASDPPASISPEELLLFRLIHNKRSCCGWQEHEEEMPHRDHDWHFVINQILSMLKAFSLQTDCQEMIIPPLAGQMDSWSSPASVTFSDFLPAAANAAHKEADS